MPPDSGSPDDSSAGTLYVVATVHLDTQWRWTVQDTIRDFLPATTAGNFRHLRRHPWFVVSFEGSFRYRLIEDYQPQAFAELREWVEQGRWRLAGSMLDAPDTNIPSPESLLRHVLYGQRYFRTRFGRVSADLFLPDCFGFTHALPTVAAHCGILGFSGQKFGNWMAPAEIPFEVGRWEGPDGRAVVACLRPEGYGEGLGEDLSRAERLVERIGALAADGGTAVGMKYVGLGDRGGALDEESIDWLRRSLDGDGPLRVVLSGSDQLFRDLGPEAVEGLPVHRGELLLPTHGTGCWTSQAAAKRWNRQCERLGATAEAFAFAADWLGAVPYPVASLRDANERYLWHQMHDDLTGTSIPAAYRFTWNDQLLALNVFEYTLGDAVEAVAARLDTTGDGIPLVVANPLGEARADLVEVRLPWALEEEPRSVVAPDGASGPIQVLGRSGGTLHLLFLAELAGHECAVYRLSFDAVEPAAAQAEATEGALRSPFYEALVGGDGRLASLRRLADGRELLAAPAGLELLPDRSSRWPAWEILHDDLEAAAESLDRPESIRVVEPGPLRASVEVVHSAAGSRFVQRYRLTAVGDHLEVETEIDWHATGRQVKLRIPAAVGPELATYDLACGVIRRGVNTRQKYEVPAQGWADLSEDGSGLSVISVDTVGWDRPERSVLRSSLVRSPRVVRKFRHQGPQDHGRHRFLHALHGHGGDWSAAVAAEAERLARPLLAFSCEPSRGDLGRRFRLLGVEGDGVVVRSLKRAEDSGRSVLRIQEARGRRAVVGLDAATPIASLRELDGCEQPLAESSPPGDALPLDLRPFELRTLEVSLAPPPGPRARPRVVDVELPFDCQAAGHQGRSTPGFDPKGGTYPAELWPTRVRIGAVEVALARAAPSRPTALRCDGRTIAWGESADRLFVLVASTEGDRSATFFVDAAPVVVHVPHWTGPIGRWKGWRRGLRTARWGRAGTGFVKTQRVAWIASHRHDARGADEPYESAYLFAVELRPALGGASSLRLPDDSAIKLFAVAPVVGAPPSTLALSPWITERRLS